MVKLSQHMSVCISETTVYFVVLVLMTFEYKQEEEQRMSSAHGACTERSTFSMTGTLEK